MGSLTRMRARNRLQTALEQRLATVDTPDAKRAIYQDAVDRLCRIALDAAELDRLAREFAVDPESISVPASAVESVAGTESIPAGRSECPGYEATCVDERRLGGTVKATVGCYDDGAIIVFDSTNTEPSSSEASDVGVVVLSLSQATAFVRLVRRCVSSDAEADASVTHLPTGSQYSLGIDQFGEEILVTRHSTSEVGFASPDEEQECLLYTEQAQDLYEYLIARGFGRGPVMPDSPPAGEPGQCATAPGPTIAHGVESGSS